MHRDLHPAMMDPRLYPHPVDRVECKQTHISKVYLAGDFVYKLRKSVNFGFLDFSTAQKRREDAERELQLNRRFCPGIYLRVEPLCRRDGGIHLGGPGEVLEHVLVMKRLPEQRLLSNLLKRDSPELPDRIAELGDHLAGLHAEAPVCRGPSCSSDRSRMRHNWEENFAQCSPFSPQLLPSPTLHHSRKMVDRWLIDRSEVLDRRESEGFVRENHGDLHSEHICFGSELCIFDCIEFNRDLRLGDTASDLAFLLMDLEYNGRYDLACLLLRSYRQRAGDPQLERLLPFYKLYRAFVRGKVSSLLYDSSDCEPQLRQASEAKARNYFALAASYLTPPVALLFCGRMGVGKSSLAMAVQGRFRSRLLRSDILRKELAGSSAHARHADSFGEGLYNAASTERTYRALEQEALKTLQQGQSVLVDASFGNAAKRKAFREHLQRRGFHTLLLHVACPDQLALARLENREELGDDPSDGRAELFEAQKRTFIPPTGERGVLEVDSSKSLEYNSTLVLNELLERFPWP